MTSIENARESALAFADFKDKKTIQWEAETDLYYLFAIKADDEDYFTPVGVKKETGEAIAYSPPSHVEDFKTIRVIKRKKGE